MCPRAIPRTARRLRAARVGGLVWCVLSAAAWPGVGHGDDREAFFEARIRPLLARACITCHSGATAPAGLRLTDRAGWADRGVIVPGDPAASRLVAVLRTTDPAEVMPPPEAGPGLSAAEIAAVEAWIRDGAVDPRVAAEPPAAKLRRGPFTLTAADRAHWAFQPLAAPPSDAAAAGRPAAETIDILVGRDTTDPGAPPVPPASPRDLVRRATFDLWGLPPSPEVVATFTADPSAAAWARLVDGLLASHHHGERWGRYWLDWVRYAETNGYERDSDKPDAWRYRDYVIGAFATDKPYDEFLVEQLAGDELAADAGWDGSVAPRRRDEALVATGFLRLHQWDDEPASAAQADLDDADDVLVSIGTAFLGLTVGCARCHDHKYDPLGQRDYYALVGFLRGLEPYGKPHRGGGSRGLGRIQRPLTAETGAMALAAVELPTPAPTFILHRGDVGAPGAEVGPAVPAILADRGDPLPAIEPLGESSGRRLALARWLASPRHPLTARVMANRVWQRHFGTGIVATPDDFGLTGAPPANPALLDFLAGELVASAWSVHHLHRIIMASATYRAASSGAAETPSYRRHRVRRLDAEAIRDTLLCLAGHLGPKDSGPPVYPALPEAVRAAANQASFKWPESPAGEEDCRSVYIAVRRALKPPFLETLDAPTGSAPTVIRPTTTTAPQALLLLNDPWVAAQAARLADRVRREAGADPAARLQRLWHVVYQRDPTATEGEAAAAFLAEETTATAGSADAAWARLCLALLNSNEAIYVD